MQSRDFEIVLYRHNKFIQAGVIPPFKIGFFELTIVLKGEMHYILGGRKVIVKSGDAIFLKKGTLRERLKTEFKSDYVSFNIGGNLDFDLPLYMENILGGNEIKLLISVCDEVSKSFHGVNERLKQIFAGILLQLQYNHEAKKLNPVIKKIIDYLRNNFDNDITLKDITLLTHFSENYINALFRKETGKTIINYLIDIKIDAAKNMLTEKNTSLKEIAEKCGFTDYNYFSRLFKSRTGYSPKQY